MKRPSASSKGPKEKAAKLDPLDLKCAEVAKALAASDVRPDNVSTMLGDVIPHCLRLAVEERHALQQSMVEALGRELRKQQAALEKAVEEAQAAVDQLTTERKEVDVKMEELDAKLGECKAESSSKKGALADCAVSYRAAREAVAEKTGKQLQGSKEVDEAITRHDGLQKAISASLEPLIDGTMPKEEAEAAANNMVPTLQAFFQVEDSLVPATPKALSKAPSLRGEFDRMAAQQLLDSAKAALSKAAEDKSKGEAVKAELSAVVQAAEAELSTAKDAQRAAAAAFLSSEAKVQEVQTAIADLKATKKLKSNELKSKQNSHRLALSELGKFQTKPLKTFEELASRSNVVPPPPADEAPAAAEMDVEEKDAAAEEKKEGEGAAAPADEEMPAAEGAAA